MLVTDNLWKKLVSHGWLGSLKFFLWIFISEVYAVLDDYETFCHPASIDKPSDLPKWIDIYVTDLGCSLVALGWQNYSARVIDSLSYCFFYF